MFYVIFGFVLRRSWQKLIDADELTGLQKMKKYMEFTFLSTVFTHIFLLLFEPNFNLLHTFYCCITLSFFCLWPLLA
jgi:hypothetical protein